MAGLFFQDRRLEDFKNILPVQNTTPFTGAIGDDKVLYFSYNSNVSLNGFTFYINPALFVNNGDRFSPTGIKPNSHYFVEITSATPEDNVWTTATLQTPSTGANSQSNLTFEWRLIPSTSRKQIEFRLRHYFTFDLADYLQGGLIADAQNRLINKLSGVTTNTNVGSVYDNQKSYGIYVYAEYTEPLFEVTTTGNTQVDIISDNPSVDFTDIFDNASPSNDYQIFLDGSNTALHTGLTPDTSPTVESINFSGTALPNSELRATTIRFVSVNDNIDVVINSVPDTIANLQVIEDFRFFDVRLIYYNEGTITNPEFLFRRSGVNVAKLSDQDNNEIEFNAEYAGGNITHSRIFLINITDYNNSQNFINGYKLVSYNASSLTNTSGDIWQTLLTIPSSDIEPSKDYRLIVLYYDNANNLVNSFLSNVIESLDVGEVENPNDSNFNTPTITGIIDNYSRRFNTDGVSNAAIWDRYDCRIQIDKTTYIGDFDANVVGVSATIENVTGSASRVNNAWQSNNVNIISVTQDDSSTLEISIRFRIQEEWTDLPSSEATLVWSLNFSTEPTTILYEQKFRIRDFENNQGSPDITDIEIQSVNSPFPAITSFANYNEPYFKVESTIDASSGLLNQMGVIERSGIIVEHETFPASTNVPQLTDAQMRNVDAQFVNLLADYEAQISYINEFTRVGVIGRSPLVISSEWTGTGACIVEPPIINPPPPAVPEFCGELATNSGGAGILDRRLTVTYNGWIYVVFNPFRVTDKCEIFINNNYTAPVATSGESAAGNYGNPTPANPNPTRTNPGEFDPLGGVDTDGNDINDRLFNNVNQRQLTGNAQATSSVWYVGSAKGQLPTRLTEFQAETGVTIDSFNSPRQVVWCAVSPSDVVTIRISGRTGTAWDYRLECITQSS